MIRPAINIPMLLGIFVLNIPLKIVAQQAIVGSEGCGTGCSFQERQLSSPRRMADGWSKVLVEKTQLCWSGQINDPNPNDIRGCNHGAVSKRWYFAKCDGDLWGTGLASDGSDAYTQRIYDEKGSPITYNSAGAIYDKWKALCSAPH